MNTKEHWDSAYQKNPTEKLGWYEANPTPALELIAKTNLPKNVHVLLIGAGSTLLVDQLIDDGFTNIAAHDISSTAFDQLKERLKEKAASVNWILDDLCAPKALLEMSPVDLWIDRAVLHFLTEAKDQTTYFNTLKAKVAKNGFVLIAEFNLDGAEKCCALPVHRYSESMITQALGDEFKLIEAFNYTFINPGGAERPYIYTLYQRINA